jgi:nucleoside-diphosphate-sugar epimerase
MSFGIAVVTGGTGFVGSRLVLALLQRGVEVRVVSSGTAARDPALALDPRVTWLGVSDADLDRAVDGATHFFNFAVVYDRPSIDDKTLDDVNVELPLRILSRFAQRGVDVTCVLGDTFFRKFPPEATRQVRYTRSKSALVDRLQAFFGAGGGHRVRAALLQIEQVYGPGEAFTKALPNVTQQMVQGVPRIAMTSGTQGRDFIYVDDVVDAALAVAAAEWNGLQVVECGSGAATTVRRVFEEIHAIAGSTSTLGFGDIKAEQAIPRSCADLAWLNQRGWTPRTSLREGLTILIEDIMRRIQTV